MSISCISTTTRNNKDYNNAGEIPETTELSQQPSTMVIVDNDPLYQSISGDLTSMRIVDVVSPSVVIEEGSFVEESVVIS